MQKAGKGERIRYAVTSSPLGFLLVARTDAGLCAVALADTEQELIGELDERYPEALLELSPDRLQTEQTAILTHMNDIHPTALPFDICGTSFQQNAWAAMQAIPRGQTLTYQQLSVRLGRPQGQIAIGQACAANPLALVIPCHRVLARGGKPHHWRWGVERKQQLLARERDSTFEFTTQHPVQGELDLTR